MANPNRPPGTTGDPGTTGVPPIRPISDEELRQIQLLSEATLVSFTATPNPRQPHESSMLSWQVAMPTTVIPGVHLELHLFGEGDQLVQPQGMRPAGPFLDTTYNLVLRAPLASRHLGALDLSIDYGACRSIDLPINLIINQIKDEANKAFPDGGKVELRGTGARVDIGINSFVVDIPLKAEVPNWFDADIDVAMGFELFSIDGRVAGRHSFAHTTVSFGTASSILSGGCSAAVAAALEAQSDGFLEGFIGPVIAGRMAQQMQNSVNTMLAQLNGASPATPYLFRDFTLTEVGLTCRFCPNPPAPPPPDRGGGRWEPNFPRRPH